jgi:hypothetical protein
VLLCGVVEGACRLPWLLDELLPELVEPELLELELPDELPAPLVPEPELEPLDPELVLVLEGVVVAAWLDPGRITATAPAANTLAAETVTVVAVSRRRPRSRSATARATRPAALGSLWLFTKVSVTRPAACAVEKTSELVLRPSAAPPAGSPLAGGFPRRAELPVFSNAQRRLCPRFRNRRAPGGARPAARPPS